MAMSYEEKTEAPKCPGEAARGGGDVRVEGERGPGALASPALRLPACFPASAAALVEGELRELTCLFRSGEPTSPTRGQFIQDAPLVEGERTASSRLDSSAQLLTRKPAVPLVEKKAPADITGESPLAGEATGMQPIAAFLPTFCDPLTGEALTYDELRKALCAE